MAAAAGSGATPRRRDALSLTTKEWLLTEPDATLRAVTEALRDRAPYSVPYASTFSRRMLTVLVYTSNRLEDTLPEGVKEHETYALLDEIAAAASDVRPPEPAERWPAEGGDGGKQTRAQLVQHMHAARFLFRLVGAPLTVEAVTEAHRLLMAGAEDSGVPVKAGAFRDRPACAGTHPYPEGDPAMLRDSLAAIVAAFNRCIDSPDDNTVVTAPVRLFYDTITLHPFENGNGRLCRLLFAYAAMRAGAPFPVPLTSGHRKARGHYMRAIFQARRGNMSELHTLALMSIEAVLCSFRENLRVMSLC